MRKLIKTVWRVLAAVTTLGLIAGAVAIGYNNRDAPMPADDELSAALDASVVWLENNRAALLAVDNHILWYFLHRAAEVSGDRRIRALVDAFYDIKMEPANYAADREHAIWIGMFKPGFRHEPLSFDLINRMNYYSQHFAYAVNCDEALGRLDGIAAQNDAAFCGSLHMLRPTCTTHQLMGIRFLQRAHCGDPAELQETVASLQVKIARELALDPRVLDVYLQRVMMLVESGRPGLVKPVWVTRILDSQHADGGWGNFQPLFALDKRGAKYFGFGYGDSRTGQPRSGRTFVRAFGIGQPTSTFHATAQGVLLLALLLEAERNAEASHQLAARGSPG